MDLGIDAAAQLIGEDEGDAGVLGLAVDGGRDLTGDATPDLVVGLGRADVEGVPYSGVVYVVDGAARGTFDLATSVARQWGLEGYEIGNTVALAGDVNGDGAEDLLMGAPYYDDSDEEWGKPRAVFLAPGPFAGATSVSDGSQMIEGEHTWVSESGSNAFGWSIAGVGDANADGFDDVLIGAFHSNNYGRAYLFNGPLAGSELSVLDADAVIDGQFERTSEQDLAGAGDTDGDGLPDLLLSRGSGAGGAMIFLSPVVGSLSTTDADAVLADYDAGSA